MQVSAQGREQGNRPGQAACQRTDGTPETCVVWLITQRSQVQILPPLPRSSRSGGLIAGDGGWAFRLFVGGSLAGSGLTLA